MRITSLNSLRADASAWFGQSRVLIGRLGWSTTSFAVGQVIRFGQNLILTRLLAPELFGIMVVLTSLRVGAELFTDIGIGQNMIASRRGTDPTYYNTAWTMQILRGVLVALLFLVLLPVISHFYTDPTLTAVMPVLCALFLLSGGHSVGLFLAYKEIRIKNVVRYEMTCAILGSVAAIAIAWKFPTVWGLIAGNVVATLISTVLSYWIYPGMQYRLMLDRATVREIISFGKWIFVSSIVLFLATNFDRLVLSKYVALSALGLYGVARSLGDVFSQLAMRLGGLIVFPSIANSNLEGLALREKIAANRFMFLGAGAAGLSLLIALSDLIVRILYDDRYLMAGHVLPWVGLATWLLMINSVSENVLLGIRKPNYTAVGNLAKFVGLLVLLPWAAASHGIIGAAIAAIAAEFARYVILTVVLARAKVHFFRQDVVATGLLLLGAMAFKELAHALHLTPAVFPFPI